VSETAIQQRIRLALGKLPWVRFFRNNVGRLPDPRTGRWVEFGVGGKGAGDLIGWRTITVTPEMVGQPIAQFVSLEVKTANGRVRPEQENWKGGASGGAVWRCSSGGAERGRCMLRIIADIAPKPDLG
jgi:hypothetical protein